MLHRIIIQYLLQLGVMSVLWRVQVEYAWLHAVDIESFSEQTESNSL